MSSQSDNHLIEDITVLDVRSDGVGAATDLSSYRAKYRVTRGDPDLQAAHAAHPFALVWDDHELVNDYNRLTVFAPTTYGSLIREAVTALYDGRVEESTAAWRKVLQLSGNFEVAYIGIGNSLMKQGDNREAMNYFKLGSTREYYSEAFKQYRKEIVMAHFGKIVLTVIP